VTVGVRHVYDISWVRGGKGMELLVEVSLISENVCRYSVFVFIV
jgi:hypothetical protein